MSYDWTAYEGLEPLKDLKGGTFIVTGGNRGIGRSVSFGLARQGANVAIIYRQSTDAEKVAKAIQDKFPGVKVRAYQCDVREVSKLEETFQQIRSDFGKFNGLVANAGVSVVKPALKQDDDDYKRVTETNEKGVSNACCVAAKSWMANNEPGSIVTIASMSGHIINRAAPSTPLTQVFYNSSKAAVLLFTKGTAAEWINKHIRVNAVSPGYVVTDQTKHMDKDILAHQKDNIPLRRFAEPWEIANQVLHLLSQNSSSYNVGTEILTDGGQTIY